MYSPRVHHNIIKITQKLAKKSGILWEEEQADIVYDFVEMLQAEGVIDYRVRNFLAKFEDD